MSGSASKRVRYVVDSFALRFVQCAPFRIEEIQTKELRWWGLFEDCIQSEALQHFLPGLIRNDSLREGGAGPYHESQLPGLGRCLLQQAGLPATSLTANEKQLTLPLTGDLQCITDALHLLHAIHKTQRCRWLR